MKFDLNLNQTTPYRLHESFSKLIEKEPLVSKKAIFSQIEFLLQTQSHPHLLKTFQYGLAQGYLLSNAKNYLLLLQLGPILEVWTKPVSKKDRDLFNEELNLCGWTKIGELTLNKNILGKDKWASIYEKEKEIVTEFDSVASLWGQVYVDAVLQENGVTLKGKVQAGKMEFISFKKGSIEFRKITSILLPPVLHGQALKDLLWATNKNSASGLYVKTVSLSEALNTMFLIISENNICKIKKEEMYISVLKKDRLLRITQNNYNYYIYRAIQENQECIEVHRLPVNHNFAQVKQFCPQKYNSLLFKAINNKNVFLGGYTNEVWNLFDLFTKNFNK